MTLRSRHVTDLEIADFVPPVDIQEAESSLVEMVTSLSINILKKYGTEDVESVVEKLRYKLPLLFREVERRVGPSQGSSGECIASNASSILGEDDLLSGQHTPKMQSAVFM